MARGVAQHPAMWLARGPARSLGVIFRAVYKEQQEEVEVRDAAARVGARGGALLITTALVSPRCAFFFFKVVLDDGALR